MITENNSLYDKISFEKMKSYIDKYKKNLIMAKTHSLLNYNKCYNINSNNKNIMNKILFSMDDPSNPYSLIFWKSF